jgi:monofunctional glycosyltransferase
MKRNVIITVLLIAGLLTGAALAAPGVWGIVGIQTALPLTTPFMKKCSKPAVRQTASLDNISPALARAVVIAEDPAFFEHRGINTTLVWNSIKANVRSGKIVRGGSSITMQLAKNLFLGSKRSWWMKYNQVVLAFTMELLLSKERILELYLNVAEWGPRVFGAETAARYHFKKHASELTTKEAAYLASLLPNPKLTTSRIYRRRFAFAASLIQHLLEKEGYSDI